jgi:hypothetical protein
MTETETVRLAPHCPRVAMAAEACRRDLVKIAEDLAPAGLDAVRQCKVDTAQMAYELVQLATAADLEKLSPRQVSEVAGLLSGAVYGPCGDDR